jgi:hypothetical protein
MRPKTRRHLQADECPIIDAPVSIPVMNAREHVTCAAALTSIVPAAGRPLVTKTRDEIIAVADVLKLKLEVPKRKTGLVRAATQRHDATVNAVYTVVDGHARMPAGESPHSRAALRVRAAVFPNGLVWIRASSADKWGTASAKLHLIDASPQLIEDLNLLVGESALAHWRQAHRDLGAALGVGADVAPDDDLRDVDILQLSRMLRDRIGDYVRVVRGMVDRDDPATIAEASRLLTPLIHFRGMLAASRAAREEASADLSAPASSSPPVPAAGSVDGPRAAASATAPAANAAAPPLGPVRSRTAGAPPNRRRPRGARPARIDSPTAARPSGQASLTTSEQPPRAGWSDDWPARPMPPASPG